MNSHRPETRSDVAEAAAGTGRGSLFDDPLFTAPPPALSDREAVALVKEHYGFDVSVARLSSERDTNFLVRAPDRKYILKITNTMEDNGVTDFQTSALLHLEHSAPDLPTPHLVRSTAGEVALKLPVGGAPSAMRLLGFLDGSPLKEMPRAAFPLASIGETLARLDLALAPFDHAKKKHALLWDSSSLGKLRPLIRFVSDPALARDCDTIVQRFVDELQPRLADLAWQVIHNDVNLNNILVSEETEQVSGIFDFGDIIHAPRVNDLAVACSYHVCGAVPFQETLGTLVAAYHRVSPLRADEIDLIFDLVIARFVTTILITSWRSTMFPDNREYIMRNNPSALEGLRILQAAGRQSVQRTLSAACNME